MKTTLAVPGRTTLLDAVHGRRSIRDFAEEAVGREQVAALLDAAVQAPTAMHRQPWSFVVIQDQDLLTMASEKIKAALARDSGPSSPLHLLHGAFVSPDFDVFHRAGTVILVGTTSKEEWATEDCCLAAQNLMLAAYARGLGTCPIGLARGWLNLPRTRKELGLPPDFRTVLPIAVGVPRSTPPPPGRAEPLIHLWRR